MSERATAIDSPYLTPAEAAQYLRYASVGALYKAIPKAGIPVRRRGRSLLFHRDDLDRWLAGARVDHLHREARQARVLKHVRQSGRTVEVTEVEKSGPSEVAK